MYSKKPAFKDESSTSPIAQIVSPLATFVDDSDKILFCSGSATQIARNLHLTARHVIYDFAEKFGYTASDSSMNVKNSIWLCHVYPGPEYAVWEANQVFLSPHSDLALIHTRPLNDIAQSGVLAAKKLSPTPFLS